MLNIFVTNLFILIFICFLFHSFCLKDFVNFISIYMCSLRLSFFLISLCLSLGIKIVIQTSSSKKCPYSVSLKIPFSFFLTVSLNYKYLSNIAAFSVKRLKFIVWISGELLSSSWNIIYPLVHCVFRIFPFFRIIRPVSWYKLFVFL